LVTFYCRFVTKRLRTVTSGLSNPSVLRTVLLRLKEQDMADGSFAQGDARRTDLDWVRIAAFGLLIFYHVGVFYAPGPSAVGAISPRPLPWLVVPMVLVNPWRLLVLFIVSGAATRFMSDKMSAGALLKSRSVRLLIPLGFGVLVVVPPQCFVQVIERCGFLGNYFGFWQRYLLADQHLCRGGPHLIAPTWNHLWFVAYLWVFTALLALVMSLAPRFLAPLQHWVERGLAGWGLVLWPACWLALAWLFLEHRFPLSYACAIYIPAFLFGYLTLKSDVIWMRMDGLRWWVLAGALLSYCSMIGLAYWVLGAHTGWGTQMAASHSGLRILELRTLGAAVYGLDQCLWILAVFGIARHNLANKDGPIRRYLTDAIFPFYIIHQTTIEVVGHYLAKERLPLGIEATFLIGATITSCFVTYEVVRRIGVLRPLFGLKRLNWRVPRLRPVASRAHSDDTA
jgi:glucans biosynthesis protein C